MAGLSSGSSLKDRETLSREDEADREEDPEYEDDLADVDADADEDPEYVEHEDDPVDPAVLGRRRWWSTDWTTRKSSNWGPKNPEDEEGCLRVILLMMRRGLLLVAHSARECGWQFGSIRFKATSFLSFLSSLCLSLSRPSSV